MLVVAVVGALAGLFNARARPRSTSTARPHGAWTRIEVVASCLVVFAATLPITSRLSLFLAANALLPADAQAHALAARQLAGGLPHGWMDFKAGGFPFSPHYQSVGVIVAALLVKAGFSPVPVVNAVGLLPVVAYPWVMLRILARSGLGPAAATAGSAGFFWCSTWRTFVSPASAYLTQGLMSQSVGTFVLLLLFLVVAEGRSAWVPILSALVIASHVQLGIMGLSVGAVLWVSIVGVRARVPWWCVVAPAFAMAAAHYGPGLAIMEVPFGWSRGSVEEIARFPGPDAWALWSDGWLLDSDRAPVFTALVTMGAFLALSEWRSPLARGVLLPVVWLVAVSMSHKLVQGTRAEALLSIVSPLRAAVLLPFACAGLAAFGLHAATCAAARGSRARVLASVVASWSVAIAFVGWSAWTRAPWVAARANIEQSTRAPNECGPRTPKGYDTRTVATWLVDLPAGRFVVDDPALDMGNVVSCPSFRGLELDTSLPGGASIGGPGSQVGVLDAAFEALRSHDDGGDARAEALGVRSILHTTTGRPRGAWRTVHESGDVELSVREGGTTFVGVGCVRERWTGSTRALQGALYEAFGHDDSRLLDPHTLTELDSATGALARADVADACDLDGATVTERPRELGAYEARVSASHPVDVVIRATWFPYWRITVDGVATRYGRVSPGFPSVRVDAGTHHIEAVAQTMWLHTSAVALALIFAAAVSPLARRAPKGRSTAFA